MNDRRVNTVVRGCALLMLGGAAAAQAQYYGAPERAGRWEVSLGARYQDFGRFDFRGPSKLDVGDSVGFGFNIGYNFDQYLSLGFEIAGDSIDYDGNFFTDASPSDQVAVSGELDTSTGQLLATWHFLPGAVTPFVSAGIGWTYIDSNIISRYDGTGCWYNPWWGGYVCSDYYDTYDDTVLSYTAAVGVRWDITPALFLRGSIGKQWLDLDGADTADTDIGRVEIGMMF